MHDLSQEIERTRERLRRLEQLQAILDDPETSEFARHYLLGNSKGTHQKEPKERESGKRAVDVIREWFKSRENHPATLREISAATQYPIPSVRQIVYSRYSNLFENMGRRGREAEFRARME
jgi:hypothetical protein